MPTDAIDLSTVTIHNSPQDIESWPATREIVRVDFHNASHPPNERGLKLTFAPDLPGTWKFFTNPGVNGDNYQFTVWIIARINGAWHTAGFIQVWEGLQWLGASPETDWKDWALPGRGWGELEGVTMQPGIVIGLFVSAGNARMQQGVTSVRERSNVVFITLPPDDEGVFTFVDTPAPVTPQPEPLPVPGPGQPPAPGPFDSTDRLMTQLAIDLGRIIGGVESLTAAITALEARIDDVKQSGVRVHL